MNIYLIRHAQSEANKARRFCGLTDTPLSAEGRASLVPVGAFFKDIHIDAIYTSPLSRATDTADIVFNNAERTTVAGLTEINFGEWEDTFVGDVMQNYKDEWEVYTNDWLNFRFPGGDNLADFQARVVVAIKELLAQTEDEDTIAIVAHNGVVKTILSYLLVGNKSLSESFSVHNATVNHVELMGSFPKLRLLNYLQRF